MRPTYFEEALSDFVYDAASGGAIRHLVDLGYSLEQILQALSYPAPREKVQKTLYRYMLESGLLRKTLPDEDGKRSVWKKTAERVTQTEGFRTVRLELSYRERVYRYLYEKIEENGEENVYLSCPFGMLFRQEGERITDSERLREKLPCLNRREQDYLIGIPWENMVMYHRLNDRMREIGRKLIFCPELGCGYYFMKTREAAVGAAEQDGR